MVVREHLRASRLLWPSPCSSFYPPLALTSLTTRTTNQKGSSDLLWSTLPPLVSIAPIFSPPHLYTGRSCAPLHTDHCRSYIHFTCCDIPTFTSLFRCVRHADYAPLCDDTTWFFLLFFFIWSFFYLVFVCFLFSCDLCFWFGLKVLCGVHLVLSFCIRQPTFSFSRAAS